MITLENIGHSHGSQILYTGASMSLFAGEKVGLVGPNGAGKSTIFRLIVGQEQPDDGRVAIDRGVAIGYFDQDVGEMSGRTVLAEVMAGAGEVSELAAEVKALEDGMADPEPADELEALVQRYGEVQTRFTELGGFELEPRAREILAGLGFDESVVDDDVDKYVRVLSGGEKVRLILARMLYHPPNFLVLDEPTNHLDLDTKDMLVRALADYAGTMLFVSHDRQFLSRVSNRVLELGGPDGPPTYCGGYVEYVDSNQYEAPAMRD